MVVSVAQVARGNTPQFARVRLGALAYREFRLLWFGLVFSNTGSWMQMLAQGWLVVELADSARLAPLYLGLVGFVRAVPILLLSGVAGALADRMDRRSLLVVSQIVMAASALTLGLLTEFHATRIWHVMLMAAISSAAAAFDAPTRQSLVPLLVEKKDLMNAIGLNSAAFNAPAIIGPALGGLAVARLGIAACFLINAASYVAVLAALALMAAKPAAAADRSAGIWSEIVEGVRYVARSAVLRGILGLSALVAVIARPYIQLLPAFAKTVTGGGAQTLGVLMAAAGAGALTGSVVTALIGIQKRRGLIFVCSAAASGVALCVFSLTRSTTSSAVMLFVLGGAIMLFMGMANTLLQLNTGLDIRGRVMSIYTMIFLGLMPLGSWILGSIASLVSLPLTFRAAGFILVLFAAAAIGLRELRDLP